jgi:hypothetical protein
MQNKDPLKNLILDIADVTIAASNCDLSFSWNE